MRAERFLPLALAGLAACTAVPGAGPMTDRFLSDAAAVRTEPGPTRPYAFVPVDTKMAEGLSAGFAARDAAGMRFFPDTAPPRPVLGVSDRIGIAIVSKSETGFIDFTQSSVAPLSTTELPVQEIGTDGRVQVPPLGRVAARGLSVQDFEDRLTAQLSKVLVAPSVVVRVEERASVRAAVLGEVARPGRFSLDLEGLRLVDLVGLAGGPAAPSEDLALTLSRAGESLTIPFEAAVSAPGRNIRVWPGDVIRIERPQRRFVVLGGVGRSGEYTFARPEISLAAAMGQASGMLSRQADRRGLFVLRRVPAGLLAAAGARVEGLEGEVPAIFQFDFSGPGALFAAQRFAMRDGDLVFVSDAPLEEVDKVLSLLTSIDPTPVNLTP